MDTWIVNVLWILIPLFAGALITYFSSPLTEKRLARIRVAEKITDKRIAAYEEIWALMIELDQARSIHDRDHIANLLEVYPFLSSIKENNPIYLLPKIFLSKSIFTDFANRFAAVLTKSSVLLDDQTLKDFNTLNVYLQVLIHYFAEMRALLSADYPEDSNMDSLNNAMNSFVYDIGIICHDDIRLISLKCEKCLVDYFERPFVFRKKRTLSISDIDQLPYVQSSFFYLNKDEAADNWLRDLVSFLASQGWTSLGSLSQIIYSNSKGADQI